MRGFRTYVIAVAALLVLCSANFALASQTTTTNTDVAVIGHAPVGDDLSFIYMGGFLRLLGGFFRIGIATPVATASTTCPQGSGYPTDGCTGAQSTGSEQVSNFFTGYTGTNYGANRTPWNVAGVDYPVGYSGTLSTLNDPSISANLPSCATYSSNLVTVNSAPCTISHLNFAMHNGIGLRIPSSITNGALVTIENNNFASGSSWDPNGGYLVSADNGSTVNVTLEYNQFDGAYDFANPLACSSMGGGCLSELVIDDGIGTFTAKYNAFLNTPQHDIQFNVGGQTAICEYNYAERVGLSPSHGDWIISNNGSGSQTLTDDHNTLYSGPSSADSHATTFCYITNDPGATLTGGCENDTMVAAAGTTSISYLIEAAPGGVVNAMNTSNNYMDDSGSFGYMAMITSGTFNGPATCSGNKSLTTGAAITGTISSYGAGWVCN